MSSNYKEIVEKAFNKTVNLKDEGKVATYIPELANVDPKKFGVHITQLDGDNFGMGDNLKKFSINLEADQV